MLELKYGQRGTKLLWVIGCCGEFPISLLHRYPGYYDYNRRIVTRMVREGYLKERTFEDYQHHVVRSVSLTKKGVKQIQLESPLHGKLILSRQLSPANGRGDWKKTLRLHRSAACFLAASQLGAFWWPGDEKDYRSKTELTYYGAYEFNTRFEKDNKGSRASGFLTVGNRLYALYFLGDHNLRWDEASEEHFREQVLHSPIGWGKDFEGNILLGNGWNLAENLVVHGKAREPRMVPITQDRPCFYYMTNDENGLRLLRGILDPQTPYRFYRYFTQRGVNSLHPITDPLFCLTEIAEFYRAPWERKNKIGPARGFFFDFQIEVMQKINNIGADLYVLPTADLDLIVPE